MKLFVFLFAFISITITDAKADPAEGLASRMQEADGKTFAVMGPNCFATAMKVSGVTSSYRGMDAKEFAVIQKNFCHKIDQPQPGDIGVFETPGFGFIHAYVFVSSDTGMQKPGVDYNGKTPISFQSLESINYTYLASPECRRYSKDVSECVNAHYYVRCENYVRHLRKINPVLEDQVQAIEKSMDLLLEGDNWGPSQVRLSQQVQEQVLQLRGLMPTEENSSWQKFVRARQVSLEKQAQFFMLKSQ